MAGNKDWLPSRLVDQANMFENVAAKIDGYSAVLGLTGAQVTAIKALCDTFSTIYTYVEQCRATTFALGEWRDQAFKKGPKGQPVPAPPAFPTADVPVGATQNVIAQFRDLREIILAAPGYTAAIGEDLMIVVGGGTSPSVPAGDATPDIKCQVGVGYEINVAGPMHGMDAMRVEYIRNGDGSTWNLVGFLTRTPGVVFITPHDPGQPEAGRIRARYIQNNVPVGNYSQEVAVTVSA